MSSGLARTVQVWTPADPAGAGVLFLWHGFGDTGANFGNAMGAAQIANQFGVVVVSAQAVLDPLESEKLVDFKDLAKQFIGQMPPTWSLFDGPGIDLVLFDDLLSCLDEQFAIDRTRVHTMGFSAGALWSTVLVLERADWLASAVLWSGGLGSTGGLAEIVYTPYETPARDLPVLAASGGATDVWPNTQLALVNFTKGSDELTAALTADGHDVVRCDHGLGHTVPGGAGSWGIQFLLDHHWRPEGGTLYDSIDGIGFPDYCTLELGAK
jgi:poly(3-hydroxybutyrate) depolymerase